MTNNHSKEALRLGRRGVGPHQGGVKRKVWGKADRGGEEKSSKALHGKGAGTQPRRKKLRLCRKGANGTKGDANERPKDQSI